MAQGGAVELPSEAPKNAIEGRWCGTWALAGTALALAAFGVGKWQGQTTGSSASNGPVPFVSSRGSEEFPAFSLDVAKVAFPWSGTAGDNIDIYVQVVGSSHLFRLSRNPATGQWRATGSLTATRAYDSLTGAALEFLTVDQVNLGLPRSLAGSGDVEVALSEDGKAANRVRVNVR